MMSVFVSVAGADCDVFRGRCLKSLGTVTRSWERIIDKQLVYLTKQLPRYR